MMIIKGRRLLLEEMTLIWMTKRNPEHHLKVSTKCQMLSQKRKQLLKEGAGGGGHCLRLVFSAVLAVNAVQLSFHTALNVLSLWSYLDSFRSAWWPSASDFWALKWNPGRWRETFCGGLSISDPCQQWTRGLSPQQSSKAWVHIEHSIEPKLHRAWNITALEQSCKHWRLATWPDQTPN